LISFSHLCLGLPCFVVFSVSPPKHSMRLSCPQYVPPASSVSLFFFLSPEKFVTLSTEIIVFWSVPLRSYQTAQNRFLEGNKMCNIK
jgi:hypothetical protein